VMPAQSLSFLPINPTSFQNGHLKKSMPNSPNGLKPKPTGIKTRFFDWGRSRMSRLPEQVRQ
ncbi:MAG: hypothetical protein LBH56_03165, partial [Coriobacteriales bacterium]|nr:hypothetical protein [Coriobacteriales bacterium]